MGVETHSAGLDMLETLGLKVNKERRLCNSLEEVYAYIEEWTEKRAGLAYDIDGIVLKLNNLEQQRQMGTPLNRLVGRLLINSQPKKYQLSYSISN